MRPGAGNAGEFLRERVFLIPQVVLGLNPKPELG
jgi:hypothetical protein